MEIKSIKIEKPEEVNLILGQSHFIKSLEDLYEAMKNSVPNARFGIAFCESSQKRLVRSEGNDEEMKKLAVDNAMRIAAGHVFIILMRDCYPINVLNAVKMVPEVCGIYCATANPVQVIVAETDDGRRGVLGVIDGGKTMGVEKEEDVKERRDFLRKIGYKL